MAGVSCLAFFFDVSAAFESIGTDRVPIFDRPVSGRETLSQLVFVLALHFVQHLDGSPPGHGQPVQTHCCSYLQPQRWPTSAHVMVTTPQSGSGPDDGLHEELYGGRMLPENKQALDRLYDAKQSQAESTGRALLDPETTRLRPKDAMQFWTAAKNQPKPTPRPQVTEQKSEVMERHFAAANE